MIEIRISCFFLQAIQSLSIRLIPMRTVPVCGIGDIRSADRTFGIRENPLCTGKPVFICSFFTVLNPIQIKVMVLGRKIHGITGPGKVNINSAAFCIPNNLRIMFSAGEFVVDRSLQLMIVCMRGFMKKRIDTLSVCSGIKHLIAILGGDLSFFQN